MTWGRELHTHIKRLSPFVGRITGLILCGVKRGFPSTISLALAKTLFFCDLGRHTQTFNPLHRLGYFQQSTKFRRVKTPRSTDFRRMFMKRGVDSSVIVEESSEGCDAEYEERRCSACVFDATICIYLSNVVVA
jgi:hypothetical protein